ncbi:putative Phosphatase yqaB [Nitrospina gracilis 3/211]|uniref:Putative Phosphatase yqaB n=1 Tax=Nitrospina gracilis (strain 3/211) TaxID=1266370 RepID=M1YWH1_NITG3|nr:HAD family phosphatase [Nitrospina gracilis]MCF8722392.1 HAD superfamily hydrolase (TIGR01509 family) [Nitrospina sp. Nb-3]CCQ90006.1 putative Phosphatase yqaB [Nitrospina gracilis 3/211]
MSTDLKTRITELARNSEGVILDFDGLIADSEPFHYKAYNAVFERYGHSIDPDEYWVEFTSKGKGLKGEIERYNLKLDVTPEAMREEKFEIYSRFCQGGDIKLFPDAMRFMEVVTARFRVAIASGSWEHDIRAILENAGAGHMVKTILGKSPGTRREKPAPDIFLQAAEQLGLQPGRCFVVEDALKGLQAAKDAGMACVIVRNPLNQNIDFSEADVVVSGLAEFLDHL